MFYGKIITGLLGVLVAGPIGLIVGLFIGHFFDKGLVKTLQFGSPENIARIKASFFNTTFLLLGYMAKADGRVSQQEIEHTETIFSQMGLGAAQREHAKTLFRQGASAEFNLESTVSSFRETCGGQKQLQQTMLLFLISLALADQSVDATEHAALLRIAQLMGFSAAELEQLLTVVQAQGQFHSSGGSAQSSSASLPAAYAALGVSASVSDKDLKRAYRKLMSQNHPDKLIAKGVPEDMIKVATEKSQDIQGAYEMIHKHRAKR
jgi:DnaJ like chaperone protein